MQPFDIVNNPLDEGANLIEAGAGTGKTYALTAIFLRLLLEKSIDPDRILVVTFTTAATAELRDRLRRQLLAVRRFLEGGDTLDDTLRAIVQKVGATPRTRDRIGLALREFDRVAIFTIHGFCQRLLGELAFETGSPFDVELVTETSELIQSVADDYWRRVLNTAAPEIADYALARMRGPEMLADLYQRFGMPDIHLIPESPDLPPIDFDDYRQGCDDLRRLWTAERGEIATHLLDPSLSGTVYGSLKPLPGETSGRSRRALKVEGWCRALDHFLACESAPLPPEQSLNFFATNKIVAATRKGKTPPTHAFFDACQALLTVAETLQEEMEAWLTAVRYGFFRFADSQLEEIKQTGQTLFFDDLLVRVNLALEGEAGGRLAALVRSRFQAALVDEFQDTDTTQYAIFKGLFDTPSHHLFMIGDPKQAIYAFRGADIFSYLKAARHARRKFTLVENWRSRPVLIRAINLLFGRRHFPFIIPEIVYHPAGAARGNIGERTASAPLVFWHMRRNDRDSRGAGRTFTKQEAFARILNAMAAEVTRLLRPPATDGSSPEWSANDMAVLVRTNRQARMVKAAMQEAGIPAVIHKAGSVFDTPEADELLQVLQAVAHPGDTRLVKTAAATRLFGKTGEQLAFGDQEPTWWNELQQRFYNYYTLWRESGFYPFYRRLLTENQVADRLLKLTDGERRLTNLLHLSELLQETVAARRLGLQETLKWLREKKALPSGRSDDQQLRLESDDRALAIITIHKSKGLEFPIVFCPFAWESETRRDEWPLFHDPTAGMRRTLYIGAQADADCLSWTRTERQAESLRLFYVAVTRARSRCYLVWGDLPGAATSPLGYLLEADASGPDPVGGDRPAEHPDGSAYRALAFLARQADGAIAIRPLPEPETEWGATTEHGPALTTERRMTRRIDLDWAIASFSSLTRGLKTDGASPEYHDPELIGGKPQPVDQVQVATDTIHQFPKGAHAGNFFHRLFEVLDYGPSGHGERERGARVAEALRYYGFDLKWKMPVVHLIENVLAATLPSARTPFSLNRLDPKDCVKEMPFSFPLRPLDAGRLAAVFNHRSRSLSDFDLEQRSKALNFVISGGYLRGFIDLVFRFQDRYYLLDWKSNHLGNSYADYNHERIRKVMVGEYYFLQYHLYVLALDQFLRLRLPGYAYERDFGGVYYLFIRGIQPKDDNSGGIFFDRPEIGLVEALRSELVQTGR